ncbi:TraM-binding TraD/TraG-like protein [Solirubrobacter pauli]|uniref:TraM-binding TraD/TraG-like protein n=1 Tax=Solirubrobacter pauli TaxID=166793 RepID=A0A660L989_9ACTN|nr:TraM recognition domain-containing protein [Solirubrobacter pauli]RKQ90473.1 TraM-binding TraD/TraG-like protein [Solirubrobacter pauli]
MTALLGACAALALAPALATGGIAAIAMRRRGLRFTWSLAALPVLALPLLAIGPLDAVANLERELRSLHAGAPRPLTLINTAAAFWLPCSALVATAGKLWIDRRDRLHGGSRETRSRASLGPLQLLALRHQRARAAAAGRTGPDGTFLLGHDSTHGRPFRVPLPQAHATIVGGSNTGKTNTAEILLEGAAAAGGSFVILDGKGGRDLARSAYVLGERYARPVALWSVLPYGDEQLDALRLPWNVAGGGNPTEIKDRIASSEEQAEPYYEAVAARGVLAATQALHAVNDGQADLRSLAELLDSPDNKLIAALEHADPTRFESTLAWLRTLGDAEKSGLRGMGLRLHTMIASDGGQWLLPDPRGQEIDLYTAIRDGWLVVFTLPQGSYPELIPHVARYTISAVNAVAGRLEREGHTANAVLFIDELSAFDGDQLCATYERARSAGIRVATSTQSLSNLEDVGGTKLLHAALDNAELIIVHRQAVPDTVELLSSLAGTVEAWEHTHKIDDAHSFHMGLDEVGERNRRLTDKFRVHPNQIKHLGKGQAVVISQRPTLSATPVNIAPGLSAIRRGHG